MRKAARRRLPRFAFEYRDGGAGEDAGIARNWRAFDAVEFFPRYGVSTTLPSISTKLFGRSYAGRSGVAPMGSPSVGFPGADRALAPVTGVTACIGKRVTVRSSGSGEVIPAVFHQS